MPKCLLMAAVAVAETLKRADITLLSSFMILSLSCNSLKARARSWRRTVTDSTDWQVWSCSASVWLANVIYTRLTFAVSQGRLEKGLKMRHSWIVAHVVVTGVVPRRWDKRNEDGHVTAHSLYRGSHARPPNMFNAQYNTLRRR